MTSIPRSWLCGSYPSDFNSDMAMPVVKARSFQPGSASRTTLQVSASDASAEVPTVVKTIAAEKTPAHFFIVPPFLSIGSLD
ncbi:hypothetical protein D3C87_1296760 [compost metagenome]